MSNNEKERRAHIYARVWDVLRDLRNVGAKETTR
jgi:hypothetical protein